MELSQREMKLAEEQLELNQQKLNLKSERKSLQKTRCSLCMIGEKSEELKGMIIQPKFASGNSEEPILDAKPDNLEDQGFNNYLNLDEFTNSTNFFNNEEVFNSESILTQFDIEKLKFYLK